MRDRPLDVDVPIDTAAATDAFLLKHLYAFLADEARRDELRESAKYGVKWSEKDGEVSIPKKDWKCVFFSPSPLPTPNPLPKGGEASEKGIHGSTGRLEN